MKPPSKEETRSVFAPVAEKYRRSADHSVTDDREFLAGRLELDPGMTVLDVASGGGHMAATLSRRVRSVVVTDLTPAMVREARLLFREEGLYNGVFVAADAETLPFREGAFDRVTSRIAPHHFSDLSRAVSEMARVLKPGGYLGIIDSVVPEDGELDEFINLFEKVRDPSHVRSLTLAKWSALLRETGFSLHHMGSRRKEHPFPEWVRRTGQPEEVQGRVEEIFLGAPPHVQAYLRLRVERGRILSYSDEKGILVGRKT
jgi:ubiquinone/menaquinone biosynthesis C-methylase UbiE